LWETTTDVVVVIDERSTVLYVNPAVKDMFGYGPSELENGPLKVLIPERLRKGHDAGMKRYIETNTRALDWSAVETRGLHRSGVEFPIEISFSDTHVADRRVFAGFIRNTTARKYAEAALLESERRFRRLAHFDSLTGLPNRAFLFEQLLALLAAPLDDRRALSLLLLDLDGFKNVNDSLGHATGDLLLCETGQRLQRCVREGDVVARLGGDEFAVILRNNGLDGRAAEHVATRMLKAIEWPYHLDGHDIAISTSIGIALAPRDSSDADTLLKYADTAMYAAKDRGRNHLCFYVPEMNRRAMHRRSLEASLRRAVDADEFELYFQPKWSAGSGACVGLEALLRWNSPTEGVVTPANFISVLEETGLIVTVGRWVIRSACEHMNHWRKAGLTLVPVAVNMSARQFHDRELASDIELALRDFDIAPALLELEITESTMMSSINDTDHILARLRVLGVTLSVDDFGTGYSSLAYLKRFPVDALKIDNAFIRDITLNPDDAAIAIAIITMAHSLKLRVIAEGVETAAQAQFLREHGCDELQGFFLGYPAKANEACAYLALPEVVE